LLLVLQTRSMVFCHAEAQGCVRAEGASHPKGAGTWDTSAGSYEPKVLRPTEAAHVIPGSVEVRGPGRDPAWANKTFGLNSGFDASAWPTAPPRLGAEDLALQRATWVIRLAPKTVEGGAVQCATTGALLEARLKTNLVLLACTLLTVSSRVLGDCYCLRLAKVILELMSLAFGLAD
jgi:hypothetical protein